MTITRPAARLFLQESAIQQGDRLKEAEAQVSGGWGGGGHWVVIDCIASFSNNMGISQTFKIQK